MGDGAFVDPADLSRGGTVVLIEHEDRAAAQIQAVLQRSAPGWTMHRAGTLAHGLELCAEQRPDLVLVGLDLPDARGLAGVRSLREQHPSTPLIVESSAVDDSTTSAALRLGAQDYLMEDEITAEGLARAIRYSLARHQAHPTPVASSPVGAVGSGQFGDFAHTVAHDLRAPIRTARLLADRLIDRVTLTDDLGDDLAMRLEAVLGRMDDMVISMLDYADLGHAPVELHPVSLHWVVDEARLAVAADLDAAGSSLVMPIDPLVQVWGRNELIGRVIVNLLSNSIQYRRRGERLVLRFEQHATTDWVTLSCIDNGRGVPPSERERVFLPLERAHPDAEPGVGLGLAICRRIVESLGGTIWIEGNALGGSTVHVKLRRAPDIDRIGLG
jgi:signal transduction histidine kinase